MHPWVVADSETSAIIATFDLDVDAYSYMRPGMTLYHNGKMVLVNEKTDSEIRNAYKGGYTYGNKVSA